MQIVPMRDLKNKVEIERRFAESDEANLVNKGIAGYEAGKVVDGKRDQDKILKDL